MDSKERDKKVSQPDVPFVAYERAEAAYERHIKRYWILCLVLLGLLVASNLAWLAFMYGFDFETHEVTADGGANAYYNEVAGDVDGGVNNRSYDGRSYGGNSYDGMSMDDGNSYGGSSYARGRGSNAKRDSIGRFSRDGYSGRDGYSREGNEEALRRVNELMSRVTEPQFKNELQHIARDLEQM